ncbi:MAG: hypothetical protein JJ868_17300 [Shimia sp.]|uniref:phosphoribosyltransferase-like protein n=1 Tax=Shimia sp. TaxID=1954381 RepID=UPI001B26CDD4|nr:hypothetical protein [Shimia sp.]MBO6899129.1 hypothetical protein [Shimia sp.]
MDAKEFKKLSQIVSEKKWDLFDDVRPDGKTILDVLVEFFSPLKPEEREIVSNLLENYLVIQEYGRHVIQLLKEVVERANGRDIVISAVKDYGATKVKSGAALTFEMNSYIRYFEGQKFLFSEDPSSERFQQSGGFKVLVDDFIGTGNQFLKMNKHLLDGGHDAKVDLVAAIVIQVEGKIALEKAGFAVYAPFERPRSIEQLIQISGRNAKEVYAIYDEIERRIACHADYKRGYGQSEAAVSLKKTPNNTLPIFWFQGKNRWPAPFPRPRS